MLLINHSLARSLFGASFRSSVGRLTSLELRARRAGDLVLNPWRRSGRRVAQLRYCLVEEPCELGVELALVGCEEEVVGTQTERLLELGGGLIESCVPEANEEGEHADQR